MNEDKKTYSVIGRVEIGTDEYRDLIEGLAEAKREASENNSERWNEYRRANDAEAKLRDITAKYEELAAFVKSDDAINTKFKLYRIEMQSNEACRSLPAFTIWTARSWSA